MLEKEQWVLLARLQLGAGGCPWGLGCKGRALPMAGSHRTEQGIHEGLLCRPEAWAALPSLCPQLPRGHLPVSLMGVGGPLGPPLPGGGCPKCTHWVEGLLPWSRLRQTSWSVTVAVTVCSLGAAPTLEELMFLWC